MAILRKDTQIWTVYVLMISFFIYLISMLSQGILTYNIAEKKALLLTPEVYPQGMTRETLELELIGQYGTRISMNVFTYIIQTLVSVAGIVLCIMTFSKWNDGSIYNEASPIVPFALFFFFISLGCLSAFGAAAIYKDTNVTKENEKFIKGYIETMTTTA